MRALAVFLLIIGLSGGAPWRGPALAAGISGVVSCNAFETDGGVIRTPAAVTVPTCMGELLFPSSLVGVLNDLGDEFHLTVQIRNDNDDNRTYSNALVIDAIEGIAPLATLVAGRIIDAAARTGVAGAQIHITPEGGRITSGVGGFFTSTNIAPGTYKVEISAEGYYTKE
ncbi:MAG: carboxypeptidase regulatory-like domain-containing protein, partial [Desulfobacterales bacterium]|nr:carboxypeptidase regulatory-like domain-containing protein [Desulfobacterales bacterium]